MDVEWEEAKWEERGRNKGCRAGGRLRGRGGVGAGWERSGGRGEGGERLGCGAAGWKRWGCGRDPDEEGERYWEEVMGADGIEEKEEKNQTG
jgi:hypothetical protein